MMLQLLIFAAFAWLSEALNLKLLEPNERTMWTTGADVEVFWKIEGGTDGSSVKNIEFDLMQGRSKRPQLVDNIAFGVDLTHGDAFWTVKDNLPDGDDYFIRVTSPDDKTFAYESGYFTIKHAPKGSKKGGKQKDTQAADANSAACKPSGAAAVLLAAAISLLFCL